ncbi:conserved virulence factor C family protein [Bacillus sp. FJAT-45350]|uniref:conserved virulence factor C family protein n=1 Tax=Bacillus sp. FJAT-45350 TaxID=2011014 RepID=UPI000BB80570|nr:conserved virulence factor C family protein [Bacillus sp. FJAT-45350]
MKLISIEPTPSPNSMKINLSESLPSGESKNFKKEQKAEAPAQLKKLLDIDGVTGVFHVANFIAVERHPKKDWQEILQHVRQVFGEESFENGKNASEQPDDSFGEAKVLLQVFRGIPMQIKVETGGEETRFGLAERFTMAAMKAESASDNLVMERQWKEYGVRYGDIEEIGKEVEEELEAAYDQSRLDRLVNEAFNKNAGEQEQVKTISSQEVKEALQNSDWKVRFAALEKLNPKEEDIELLGSVLKDDKASIRRLATVYLGMIEIEDVLPYIYQALKDSSVTVRRTAGDCLSDLGFSKAIPAMIEALNDKNKLVRWRAAMFLYELGDETAIEALRAAEDDPEFEVSLQVRMALKRIESGEEAAGSVWQQMTNARKNES